MKKFLEIFCVLLSANIVHGLLSIPEGTNTLLHETTDLHIREQHVEESARALNTADGRQLTHVEGTSNNNDLLVLCMQALVDAGRGHIHGVSQVDGSWITEYPLNRGTDTTTQATTTTTPASPPPPSATTTTSPTTTIHIESPTDWDFCKRFRRTGIWRMRLRDGWMSNLERMRKR